MRDALRPQDATNVAWRTAIYEALAGDSDVTELLEPTDGETVVVVREVRQDGEVDLTTILWERDGKRHVGDMFDIRTLLEAVAPRAQEITGKAKRLEYPGITEVCEWIQDPDTWSPYVDEIAIARALDFDWDVIHNLSRAEVAVFLDRLAAMDDAFDTDDALREGRAEDERDYSPRRARWLEADPEFRNKFRDRIANRRQRRAA